MSDQPATRLAPAPGPALRLCHGMGRLVARLALAALILFTLYLSAGRLLLPRVGSAGAVAMVETQLSTLLGIRAHIEGLEGSWRDFTPQLRVGSLLLEAPDGTTHRIDEVSFAIDVWRSLAGRSLAITGLSVRAVELAVEQGPDGRWALAGTRAGPSGDYSRQILRFLLNTPDLNVSEATIAVRPRQGEALQLHAVFARIENAGDIHRAQLQFRLDEQSSPSRLLLEMNGMPDVEWTLQGWLTLPQLELRPLAQLGFAADWDIGSAAGSASLWFDATSDGAVQTSGVLRDLTVQADSHNDARRLALRNGRVDFRARRAAAGNWRLALSDTGFDWGERTWSLPALSIERPDAAAPLLRVRGEGVELGMANALALDVVALPERAAQALRTLQPEGTLHGMQFETALDGSYPNLFQLRARLSDGAAQAWNATPAGSGIEAWVQADVTQGLVELDDDDLQLHLPRLFDTPWHYTHVNGRVHWQLAEDGEVRVWSKLLDVTSPDLDGRVGFSLHNWQEASGERDSEFKLLVGVQRMAVVPGKVYLPNLDRLANTMGWLQGALQGGTLHDSAFMLRSSRTDRMEVSSSAQSWYRVENGTLRYLQDWPALEQTTATVLVRDQSVDVQGQTGSIAGMVLEGVSAQVRPEEGGSWLRVRGRSNPDTATGHRFLLDSPLHETIGAAFDTWQGQGSLQVALDLGIPLGGNPRERAIDVQVVTHDSALQIPEFALDFSAIDGELHYSLAEGLRAQGLSAQLFGEPVMADIVSAPAVDGARETRVTGSGSVTVEALRDWPTQPRLVSRLLERMDGALDVDLSLAFPSASRADGSTVRLQLTSDLVGVQSDLPAPFTKSEAQRAPLELEYAFSEGRRADRLTLRYDDLASGTLVLDERGVTRGQVYFGARNGSFNVRQVNPAADGLLVSGELEAFDYDAWSEVATALMAGGGDGRPLNESLRLVDVNVGEFTVRGQALTAINLQVQPQDGGWHIQALNPLLSGTLVLPADAGQPWQVDLDYLRFPPRPVRTPEEARAAEKVDLLARVDPAQLPAFDFQTDELSIGTSKLGSFSFALRPDAAGARIDGFRMQAANAAIAGLDGSDATGGAGIVWDYRDGVHHSYFEGLFTATDLAKVLPDWGHDAFVESGSARFSGQLDWVGSPLAFSPKRSTGHVSMRIEHGRFVDIDSGSSRLLGAFNFDALVRRLQLDFSDLFQRGFAYDQITGELEFDQGVIATNNSLIIDGPSSRLRIDGEINLPQETIAADMVVRIPLSQNISMLAGLLGAWPIAVSTYVASKIFADQLDEFTTLVYRLDGPWNNVEAGFEAPTPEDEQGSAASALPDEDAVIDDAE